MARNAKRSSKSGASNSSKKPALSTRGLTWAATTGLRRGSSSRPWMYLGVLASGVRVLRWLMRPKPATVYRAVLEPGESLEIVTRSPKS